MDPPRGWKAKRVVDGGERVVDRTVENVTSGVDILGNGSMMTWSVDKGGLRKNMVWVVV